jgi:uncharacterized membrane protein
MNFSILNSIFLWLLPLSLLPVVFHLFFRFRRKTVQFPSFMFFYMIDQKFSARRKLREYLILLTRILFLIFFLLALAQIIRFGGGDTNTRQATVIVIDNSSSMGVANRENISKLDIAQEAANALVSTLKDGDQAAVVLTVNDPTASLPGECIGDKKLLKSSIDSIAVTEAQSNIPGALTRAFSILRNDYATRYEIHVFSDIQEHEWKRSSLEIVKDLPNTEIFVHRLATLKSKKSNVNISSIDFLQKRCIINRSVALEVTLANSTAYDAEIQLNFEDDSGAGKANQITVSKNGEKVVSYIVTPKTPGLHWIRLKIEGDAFSGDNQASVAYFCFDKEKVLLCGQKKDFGTLPLAISPDGKGTLSGLVIASASYNNLSQTIRDNFPIMTVITWDGLSQLNKSALASLKNYVLEGGNLLVLPRKEQNIPSKIPSWLHAKLERMQGSRKQSSSGYPMMLFDKKSSFWSSLRDDRGDILLQNLVAYKFNPLILKKGFTNLIGMEDGRILIAFRNAGKGHIFVSGINFFSQSSNLPLKTGFLPLIHKIALSNENKTSLITQIRAGSGIPGKTASESIHVQSVAGAPLDWKGTDEIIIPRTGVYSLQSLGGVESSNQDFSYVSVSSSPREGIEKFISDSTIPMLEGFKYFVSDFSDIDFFVEQFNQRRSGFNYFIPLLLLALGMLLFETFIANHGKSRFGTDTKSKISLKTDNKTNSPLAFIPAAAIQWHPDLSPIFSLICIALISVVIYLSWKHLHERLSRWKVLMVIIPRIIILVLIMMAFFDPVIITEKSRNDRKKLLIVLDSSSSMDVKDKNSTSRYQRGKKLVKKLTDELPSGIKIEELEFDTQLRKPDNATDSKHDGINNQNGNSSKRGTDLAGTVIAINDRSDISSFCGIVMLTDGGDEVVEIPDYPVAPLYIVGIGNQNITSDDLAIDGLKYPPESEKDIDFEVTTDISATFSSGIPKRGFPIKLILERKNGDKWEKHKEKDQKMMSNNARISFRIKEKEAGTVQYRVIIKGMDKELSLLNNSREFKVNIHKRSLHILYFTRKLSVNFKIIRSELARDPGISFTAMIRTMKDNFIVQGDRISGDDKLTAGFPDKLKLLQLYDTVIIDSFPAAFWRPEQVTALKNYIENGGSAIFLGGEYSFSDGGYASSPLSPLFPWNLRNNGLGLKRGVFPVTVPGKASFHPIVLGIREILSEVANPVLESLNLPGSLKPSAEAIINAEYKGRKIPVIAINPYGKGQVMGIATNMLWKWATTRSKLRKAYSIFWRQGVRNLVEKDHGGRSFSVKWNKSFYRPGEEANAVIRGSEDNKTGSQKLVASLTYIKGGVKATTSPVQQIPIEKIIGENHAYSVKLLFRNRGEYKFRLTVYSEKGGSEIYEKIFSASPLLSEGSDLGLNQNFLTEVAEKGGGHYYSEELINDLIKDIREKAFSSKVIVETSLIHNTPWFFFLILMLLIIEWCIRRKVNLI